MTEKRLIIENWKTVLKKSFSVWAMYFSILFSGLEVSIQLMDPDMIGIEPGLFAAIAGVVSALAVLFRLIPQPSISKIKIEENPNADQA